MLHCHRLGGSSKCRRSSSESTRESPRRSPMFIKLGWDTLDGPDLPAHACTRQVQGRRASTVFACGLAGPSTGPYSLGWLTIAHPFRCSSGPSTRPYRVRVNTLHCTESTPSGQRCRALKTLHGASHGASHSLLPSIQRPTL